MTTFKIYRNGKAEYPQHLKDAVAWFYARERRLPGTIVVPASELTEAQAAAKVLKLAVEIGTTGGCLVPEVWLGEERGKADVD